MKDKNTKNGQLLSRQYSLKNGGVFILCFGFKRFYSAMYSQKSSFASASNGYKEKQNVTEYRSNIYGVYIDNKGEMLWSKEFTFKQIRDSGANAWGKFEGAHIIEEDESFSIVFTNL